MAKSKRSTKGRTNTKVTDKPGQQASMEIPPRKPPKTTTKNDSKTNKK